MMLVLIMTKTKDLGTVEAIFNALHTDYRLVLNFKALYPEIFACPVKDLAGAWNIGINALDSIIPECRTDLTKRLAYMWYRMRVHGVVK